MSISRFQLAFTAIVSLLLLGDSELLYGQSSTRSGGEIQYAAPSEADSGEKTSRVVPASWIPKVTLPKITMPRLPKLWPSAEGSSPALLAPVAAGAKKISAGAKKAWEGTKDILSFKSKKNKSTRQKRSKPKPSIWKRMLAPAEPTVPQTMGEWMSQPR